MFESRQQVYVHFTSIPRNDLLAIVNRAIGTEAFSGPSEDEFPPTLDSDQLAHASRIVSKKLSLTTSERRHINAQSGSMPSHRVELLECSVDEPGRYPLQAFSELNDSNGDYLKMTLRANPSPFGTLVPVHLKWHPLAGGDMPWALISYIKGVKPKVTKNILIESLLRLFIGDHLITYPYDPFDMFEELRTLALNVERIEPTFHFSKAGVGLNIPDPDDKSKNLVHLTQWGPPEAIEDVMSYMGTLKAEYGGEHLTSSMIHFCFTQDLDQEGTKRSTMIHLYNDPGILSIRMYADFAGFDHVLANFLKILVPDRIGGRV